MWKATKKELTSTRKLILLAHAKYADWQTGSDCRPGAHRLALDTGFSTECIHRNRKALESLGWLRVVRLGGALRGDRREATEYQLCIPQGFDIDRLSDRMRHAAIQLEALGPGDYRRKDEDW